jgi:hypothetical protein
MNHPDHEIEMARSELYSIAKYAMALHEMLENVSELDGMQGWQQSKITRAADYMESVYQSLTHEMKFGESAPEGWEGTVKAMKKHKEIDNPWALAHYMKNKGYKSHKKEKSVAEGADDKFSVADKVEELVSQYHLYDKRGWTDLFTKLAGRKLQVEEIRREMEYTSKFLNLLDSIRMRSDYRGQQDPRKDQELIDLSNQWLSLFNKATSEFKGMSGQGMDEDDEAVAAFLAKGGKIQHVKPQKGPKTPGLSYASKHIGAAGGRGSSKGKVSGLGANTGKTSNKPVVTAETGYGRNKDYNPGFASPHAPTNLGRGPDHRGLGQELAHERNNYGVHFDGKQDPWKVFASQREAENIAKSLRAKGRQVDVYVTGLPATNESVEENKKGVRAVKHTTKPRNPVMAGDKPGKATVTHKNKKKDQQRGVEKHKGKEPAYEGATLGPAARAAILFRLDVHVEAPIHEGRYC